MKLQIVTNNSEVVEEIDLNEMNLDKSIASASLMNDIRSAVKRGRAMEESDGEYDFGQVKHNRKKNYNHPYLGKRK